MSTDQPDAITRALELLTQAREGKADALELAESSIALKLLREHLVDLFSFPTFPEQAPGVYRLGSWESLPPKQRSAYEEVKRLLDLE